MSIGGCPDGRECAYLIWTFSFWSFVSFLPITQEAKLQPAAALGVLLFFCSLGNIFSVGCIRSKTVGLLHLCMTTALLEAFRNGYSGIHCLASISLFPITSFFFAFMSNL